MISRSRRPRRGLTAVALAAVLTLLLSVLAACGSGSSEGDGDAIRIGAVLPLTGPAAELGESWKAGVELAVDRINDEGGIEIDGTKHEVSVKIVDDESTPAGAQRVVQELLNEDYQLFLGPSLSSSFQTAYATLKDDERRLVMTPSLVSESMLEPSGRLFKVQPSQGSEAVAGYARQFAEFLKPEKVAILQPQDPGGQAAAADLEAGFEEAGVEVVYNNQVPADTRDFLPIVSAIRNTDPDLVLTPYLDSLGAEFLSQAAQVGFTDVDFANYGGSGAQVAEVPEISEFTYLLTTRAPDNPDDEILAEFREAYEKKYDEEPKPLDSHALMFYDPVLMLAAAIENTGTSTDVAKIADELRQLTEWDGKTLPLSFDDKGLIQLETKQLVTIRDGVRTFTDFS